MTTVIIIVIVLAILIWSLDRVVDLKHKFGIGKKKVETVQKSTFAVTVNYHVSSVFKYNSYTFIALNMTIVNKTGTTLSINNITAEPFHKPVNFDSIRNAEDKLQHLDNTSLLRYKPINLQIGATEASSGFVIFEGHSTTCDIDKLLIRSDNNLQDITIKQELVHYDNVLPLQ